MELFKPSQKIYDMILQDKNLLSETYHIIPSNQPEHFLSETLVTLASGIYRQIREYYRKEGWVLNEELMDVQKLDDVVGEGLKNTVGHGTKNKKPAIYGLFMGEIGICHGFYDGGDYFKSEKIKQQYENKKPITEFTEAIESIGSSGGGTNGFIYPASDCIEVDSNKGVLYIMQFKESLRAKN